MDFEVINVQSLSEHFTIVELKELPAPLLLGDACPVPNPTSASPITPQFIETQPQQVKKVADEPAELNFDNCLKSGNPSDFLSIAELMTSKISNMKIQIEACKALAAARLEPAGSYFVRKFGINKQQKLLFWEGVASLGV